MEEGHEGVEECRAPEKGLQECRMKNRVIADTPHVSRQSHLYKPNAKSSHRNSDCFLRSKGSTLVNSQEFPATLLHELLNLGHRTLSAVS